mgnify:FL=1
MGGTCVVCIVGFYRKAGESRSCLPCPSGFSTSGVGSTDVSACIRKYNIQHSNTSRVKVESYILNIEDTTLLHSTLNIHHWSIISSFECRVQYTGVIVFPVLACNRDS